MPITLRRGKVVDESCKQKFKARKPPTRLVRIAKAQHEALQIAAIRRGIPMVQLLTEIVKDVVERK